METDRGLNMDPRFFESQPIVIDDEPIEQIWERKRAQSAAAIESFFDELSLELRAEATRGTDAK